MSRPIEDVWHLMFEGRLPTTVAERESFAADIRTRRAIPPAVAGVLPEIASAGEVFVPLDALRTALSQYGAALGFRASHDIDAETLRDNAMSTCEVVPAIICERWRLLRDREHIATLDDN